jgi:hypothetical protein
VRRSHSRLRGGGRGWVTWWSLSALLIHSTCHRVTQQTPSPSEGVSSFLQRKKEEWGQGLAFRARDYPQHSTAGFAESLGGHLTLFAVNQEPWVRGPGEDAQQCLTNSNSEQNNCPNSCSPYSLLPPPSPLLTTAAQQLGQKKDLQ